ncbi:hypothetical protein [Dactylosporangium sp. NPDC006015]|uniref:hypothetical protein n=1 Tax=Dactylosporangium sp. NPDC006015 TaxID=3154576 RepID=UPI0033AE9864
MSSASTTLFFAGALICVGVLCPLSVVTSFSVLSLPVSSTAIDVTQPCSSTLMVNGLFSPPIDQMLGAPTGRNSGLAPPDIDRC